MFQLETSLLLMTYLGKLFTLLKKKLMKIIILLVVHLQLISSVSST